MKYTDKEYNKKQYENSNNLQSRIQIYKYNTNRENWYEWIHDRIPFKENYKILELACGNGNLWKQNCDKIIRSMSITLSDLNENMLEDCKNHLKDIDLNFNYKIIDIGNIPFDNLSFDIVIANHSLYHLPDIDKSLKEIKRILKNNGTFAATTIGVDDNKELKDLFHEYDERIQFNPDEVAKSFGLENGTEILRKHFSDVKLIEYINGLVIPESKAILDYAKSITGIESTVTDFDDFDHYIKIKLIENNNEFRVTKKTGLFLSKK